MVFQANLLSLISHELRTPLTGILNSLGMLREGDISDALQEELLSMAFRNAHQLNQVLLTLLDVSAIEGGSFKIRLNEVSLQRLLNRGIEKNKQWIHDRGFQMKFNRIGKKTEEILILADPNRFLRVIDLLLQISVEWASEGTSIGLSNQGRLFSIEFKMPTEIEKQWTQTWNLAEKSLENSKFETLNAFQSAMNDEDGFLSRTKEGLGSELLLIKQILAMHSANFKYQLASGRMSIMIEMPELKSDEVLHSVLSSRVYHSTHGLHSVALALLEAPKGIEAFAFLEKVKSSLFRSTDSAYLLEDDRRVAVVMDDCLSQDAEGLMKRMQKSIGLEYRYGFSFCPEDATDPEIILKLASDRLLKS